MSIRDEYFKNSQMSSGQYLLKFRLLFNSLNFCYMAFTGFVLLRIDFTQSEDPYVRLYDQNRWWLITSWFNLISLVYTPICIYCDWRELQGTNHARHVRVLNKLRFLCFSSIQFPATCFADILFWKLWVKNRDLVAPAAVDILVPLWLQHSLHTITLFVIIADLLLVPRRRPKNLTLGVLVLGLFLAAYAITCGRSIANDNHIYPLLRLFSGYNFIPLVIFVSAEHYFYFTIQWLVVDLVWGQKTATHALLSFFRKRSETKTVTTNRKSRKDTISNGNCKVKKT